MTRFKLVIVIFLFLPSAFIYSSTFLKVVEIDTLPIEYEVNIEAENFNLTIDKNLLIEINNLLSKQDNLISHSFCFSLDKFKFKLSYSFYNLDKFNIWFNNDSIDNVFKYFSKLTNNSIIISKKLLINKISTDYNKINDNLLINNNNKNIPFGFGIDLYKNCEYEISKEIVLNLIRNKDLINNLNSLNVYTYYGKSIKQLNIKLYFEFLNKDIFEKWYLSSSAILLIKWLNSLIKEKEDFIKQNYSLKFTNVIK
jgi:hypothetical protein